MRIVNVPLGKRNYDVKIGTGLVAKLGPECEKLGLAKRCAIISDSQVIRLYGGEATKSLRTAGFDPVTIVFPAGEQQKNLRNVHSCYDQLARHCLERKSFIVALGGGVVGDLAGFVAATYLRGLPFVQVPTTLLAQVDSSVGGKVGVNLKAGKNLVGSFHQPRLVLCDLDTFQTLPEREMRAGLAEVIKYGIIWDPRLFASLERQMPKLLKGDTAALSRVITRSCEIKSLVVCQDETEAGVRAILNFGHTIGHAIEAVSKYGRFLHGEAISIGQVAAARLSVDQLGLPAQDVARITKLFQAAGLPVRLDVTPTLRRRLLEAIKLDKKVSGGAVKFVLARHLGVVEFGCDVHSLKLNQVISQLGT